MSDTMQHPLVELLAAMDCHSIINQSNLGPFEMLNEALEKDNATIDLEADNTVSFSENLSSTGDLWQHQDSFLLALMEGFGRNKVSALIDKLDEMSSNPVGPLDLDGLYGGGYHLEGLDEWADGFTGDTASLKKLCDDWSNTLDCIDDDGVVKALLTTKEA